jgi:hypothetical protein
MAAAGQTIVVMMTFRKSNKNLSKASDQRLSVKHDKKYPVHAVCTSAAHICHADIKCTMAKFNHKAQAQSGVLILLSL